MDDNVLQKFETLITRLSTQQRKQLFKQIIMRVRASQKARIGKGLNPDGSAYTPRRPQRNQIKRKKMFVKLKTNRFLKTSATSSGAEVGFTGRIASMAKVHQYGLKAQVSKNNPRKYQYEQRELLGFSDDDIELIEDMILQHLSE